MPLPSAASSSRVCVAVVLTSHGVKGCVKVKCFLENPSDLKAYSPFSDEKGEGLYDVDKIISQKKDVLVISLKGVGDRNAADTLKGIYLTLPENRLPELSGDTFYHKDLIGLCAKTETGLLLGKVTALYNFGAGDLLEIQTQTGSLHMIPFTQGLVPIVDKQENTLYLSKEGQTFLEGGQDAS